MDQNLSNIQSQAYVKDIMNVGDIGGANPTMFTKERRINQDQITTEQIRHQPDLKQRHQGYGYKIRNPLFNDYYYKEQDLSRHQSQQQKVSMPYNKSLSNHQPNSLQPLVIPHPETAKNLYGKEFQEIQQNQEKFLPKQYPSVPKENLGSIYDTKPLRFVVKPIRDHGYPYPKAPTEMRPPITTTSQLNNLLQTKGGYSNHYPGQMPSAQEQARMDSGMRRNLSQRIVPASQGDQMIPQNNYNQVKQNPLQQQQYQQADTLRQNTEQAYAQQKQQQQSEKIPSRLPSQQQQNLNYQNNNQNEQNNNNNFARNYSMADLKQFQQQQQQPQQQQHYQQQQPQQQSQLNNISMNKSENFSLQNNNKQSSVNQNNNNKDNTVNWSEVYNSNFGYKNVGNRYGSNKNVPHHIPRSSHIYNNEDVTHEPNHNYNKMPFQLRGNTSEEYNNINHSGLYSGLAKNKILTDFEKEQQQKSFKPLNIISGKRHQEYQTHVDKNTKSFDWNSYDHQKFNEWQGKKEHIKNIIKEKNVVMGEKNQFSTSNGEYGI